MAAPGAAQASAPGKVILFGEHAVVYGEPSLSLAIDRRMHVHARTGADETTVNGEPLNARRHAYLTHALSLLWQGREPIAIETRSELPSAAGIGSSAALSVATAACLLRLASTTVPPPERVARAAFETEWAAQGAASPNDTSTSAAGGAVLLSPERRPEGEFLWRIERGDRSWNVHRLGAPSVPLLVANSGARGRTSEQVAKVRRLLERQPSARDTLREIGIITIDGVAALRRRDLGELGRLMDRNHECLHRLGVDTPLLARLVAAARSAPGTLGAKLTGAGGGGSLLVLTERPTAAHAALERAGAHVFAAASTPRGVEVHP